MTVVETAVWAILCAASLYGLAHLVLKQGSING